MAELGELMDEARAGAVTKLEKQRVALFDKGIWQFMQAGRAAYLEKEKLKAPTLQQGRAPRVNGPSVAGDPAKMDWFAAGVLGNWRSLGGQPTPRKVEGRIAHDGKFLYLQLEEQLDVKKLIITDDNVWAEDEWEIFFAKQRGRPYRQMGVNARGVHIDLRWGEENEKWDSGAKVISDTALPDRWRTPIAFPLAKLLPGGVKPGETIYLNIVRSSGQGATALAWIPTFAGYHEPTRLGEIVLEP
ncbi:MAG: hypothetical protein AUJ92_09325 [Armatimonadetes bacterium CG2_30_59_28]|nr:MAG: hypothetical protein AUJ92_09325 [Armatimonadetes bacterium CG2_30_59_28]PIU65991.1 MAG: hypothetical protein COS85_06850 [Armatimonadetes bacterium CG07_land_8_20_14_0_80_59_28]PIY40375.1 MAG: hypothetical protein COZ05_17580 [Armatimonadetes bacterium CG_4_10_14_3_um_filter_59_10]